MALRSRERLQQQVGDLGKAKVVQGKNGNLIHKVTCSACTDRGGQTYRSGQPNGYADALTRWTLHLAYAHPDVDAPCLAKLDEIKAARREQRMSVREREQEAARIADQRHQRRVADLITRFEAADIVHG